MIYVKTSTTNFIKTLGLLLISLFGLSACVATNSNYYNGSNYGTYQPKPATPTGVITENWTLAKINNAPYQGRRITLKISTDNKVNGYSGCNRYFISDINVRGNRLRFGSVGSTKKLCADYNSNQLEKKYLDALRGVTHFNKSTNRLVLEGDHSSLTYYKKSVR